MEEQFKDIDKLEEFYDKNFITLQDYMEIKTNNYEAYISYCELLHKLKDFLKKGE